MRPFLRLEILASPATAAAGAPKIELGHMPEWDLSDLYAGPTAPQIKADIATAGEEAKRMKAAYQGKLADLAKNGAKLAGAVKDYEPQSLFASLRLCAFAFNVPG